MTLLTRLREIGSPPLFAAIVVAVALRIALGIYTAYFPVQNERGVPVSPLHTAASSDLAHYQDARRYYLMGADREVLKAFYEFYTAPHEYTRQGIIITAPFFPVLLHIFDYDESNTLPLAIFFIFLSAALTIAWLVYFHARGMPAIWLVGFAALPHPLWFTINIGSDLLAAAIFTAFYFTYSTMRHARSRLTWCIAIVVLYLLTRPAAVSLLLFLIVDQLFLNGSFRNMKRIRSIGIALAVVFAPFLVFYIPYLTQFMRETSTQFDYFGYTTPEYMEGIYNDLPYWLDLLLSWFSLACAKLLYIVGLRPSYGDTSWYMVAARAAPGLIFLPGMLYLFFRGERSEKWMIALVLLPVLAGASQDRYILSVQPLLYFSGFLAFSMVWEKFIKRPGVPP